jgi:hypothetical protein
VQKAHNTLKKNKQQKVIQVSLDQTGSNQTSNAPDYSPAYSYDSPPDYMSSDFLPPPDLTGSIPQVRPNQNLVAANTGRSKRDHNTQMAIYLLAIAVQSPISIDPDLFFELDQYGFTNYNLLTIYQAICDLGGVDIGASLGSASWVQVIQDRLQELSSNKSEKEQAKLPTLVKALNILSVQELPVTSSDQYSAYAYELIEIIQRASIQNQISSLKVKLGALSPDSSEYAEINQKLMELNKLKHRKIKA